MGVRSTRARHMSRNVTTPKLDLSGAIVCVTPLVIDHSKIFSLTYTYKSGP